MEMKNFGGSNRAIAGKIKKGFLREICDAGGIYWSDWRFTVAGIGAGGTVKIDEAAGIEFVTDENGAVDGELTGARLGSRASGAGIFGRLNGVWVKFETSIDFVFGDGPGVEVGDMTGNIDFVGEDEELGDLGDRSKFWRIGAVTVADIAVDIDGLGGDDKSIRGKIISNISRIGDGKVGGGKSGGSSLN